jgi:hypothetical protein
LCNAQGLPVSNRLVRTLVHSDASVLRTQPLWLEGFERAKAIELRAIALKAKLVVVIAFHDATKAKQRFSMATNQAVLFGFSAVLGQVLHLVPPLTHLA